MANNHAAFHTRTWQATPDHVTHAYGVNPRYVSSTGTATDMQKMEKQLIKRLLV